jgi:hypothetical protein
MKNSMIVSKTRTAIPARDRVERINNQNKITGRICSFRLFFLRNHNTNTGKKAINQNPKLVGLSNKN